MKKPDEIKKALECCKYGCQKCYECPYSKILSGEESDECCEDTLKSDALFLVQQYESLLANAQRRCADAVSRAKLLEEDLESMMGFMKSVERINAEHFARNIELKTERDAAVALIPRACAYCKWCGVKNGGFFPDCKNPNGCRNISGINTGWEWRGVQKEDNGENT